MTGFSHLLISAFVLCGLLTVTQFGAGQFVEENPYGAIEIATRLDKPPPPSRRPGSYPSPTSSSSSKFSRHHSKHSASRSYNSRWASETNLEDDTQLAGKSMSLRNRKKSKRRPQNRIFFPPKPAQPAPGKAPNPTYPPPPEGKPPFLPSQPAPNDPGGKPEDPNKGDGEKPPNEEEDKDLCKYDWCNAGEYAPICVTYFTTYHRAFTLRNQKCIDFNNKCIKHLGTMSWCHEGRCYDDSIKFCNPPD